MSALTGSAPKSVYAPTSRIYAPSGGKGLGLTAGSERRERDVAAADPRGVVVASVDLAGGPGLVLLVMARTGQRRGGCQHRQRDRDDCDLLHDTLLVLLVKTLRRGSWSLGWRVVMGITCICL